MVNQIIDRIYIIDQDLYNNKDFISSLNEVALSFISNTSILSFHFFFVLFLVRISTYL